MNASTSAKVQTRPVKCHKCNERFATYQLLDEHVAHSGHKKPFSCNPCGKTFNTKWMLDRHLRAKHRAIVKSESVEKPESMSKGSEKSKGPRYKCPHCALTFPYYCRLEPHMNLHTGEGTFQCSKCPRRFVWESKLRQHFKMHEDAKPFVCDVCGKAFKRNFHLKEHKTGAHHRDNEHKNGETSKKFKCGRCDQAYAYRVNLARHMKRQHGELGDTTAKKGKTKAEAQRKKKQQRTSKKNFLDVGNADAGAVTPLYESLTTTPQPLVKQEDTYRAMEFCEVTDNLNTDKLVESIVALAKPNREVKEEPVDN